MKLYSTAIFFAAIAMFMSCSEVELPDHELDVEFKYELTCSEVFLKYVRPEVTLTDVRGQQRVFPIEDDMWQGGEHKTWTQSIHYDSLNVSSSISVKYIPRAGITYQDESAFDNVHNLSCLIIVREDGEGRRNNYTIVPDFPSKTNVTASALKNFFETLSTKTSTRGGSVDLHGEITKIEND